MFERMFVVAVVVVDGAPIEVMSIGFESSETIAFMISVEENED
jgi:hypothetical protein